MALKAHGHRFGRFIATGLFNTGFGYLVYLLGLTLTLAPASALALATLCGAFFNYLTTGRIVFRGRSAGRLPRFLLAYAGTFCVNLLLLNLAMSLGAAPWLAQAIVLPVVVITSYTVMSFLVFGGKKNMTGRRCVSIISPCFNEQDNVEPCHAAVRDIFERKLPGYDYEHIFADNASTDLSVERLRDIAAADPRVKVIANARNYGPFRSTFNALRAASGDAVLVMLPVDLQDPPELIPEFVKGWEQGYKIVYGQRQQRQEGILLRTVRRLYYRWVSRLANIDIPLNTAEFQLIDRQVVNALLRYNDHYPYIRGMIANVGFRDKSKMVPYVWRTRARGMSKNRFFNLVDQGLNGIISFTNVPLRIATMSGFVLATGAILYAIAQVIIHLVAPETAPPGIATLIAALFFFSGVQLLFTGLVGEYVASIHFQVRQGMVVIEKERINFDEPPAD